MNTEQARGQLEAAEERLLSAVNRLVAMGPGVGHVRADLQDAAEAIKKVYMDGGSREQAESLIPLVGKIRARVMRAQLLLDSAASLYCGAMTAAVSQPGAYTPEGEMQRGVSRGYLEIEA